MSRQQKYELLYTTCEILIQLGLIEKGQITFGVQNGGRKSEEAGVEPGQMCIKRLLCY